MKTLLLLLFLAVPMMGQITTITVADTGLRVFAGTAYTVAKSDTVFTRVDSEKVLIAFEEYSGWLRLFEIWKVDSIWSINQTGLVIWNHPSRVVRRHYYTQSGSRITCDSDVYFLIKTWLKTE